MPNTKEEMLKEARMVTNLVYIMVDMLHTSLFDMEQATKKANMVMRQDQKRYFKGAMHNLNMLLREINKMDMDVQMQFGDDSDMLYQFVKLLVDRCGEDGKDLYRFYNYVKMFPSKMGMDISKGEREAFMNVN